MKRKGLIASVRLSDGSRMETHINNLEDIQLIFLPSDTVEIVIAKGYCVLDEKPKRVARFVIGRKLNVEQARKYFRNDVFVSQQLQDLDGNGLIALCCSNIVVSLEKNDRIISPQDIISGYYRKPQGTWEEDIIR